MLGDEKKLERIRNIAKKYDIKAHQIGENTPISNKTAYNILHDKEIKPRTKTLNIIEDYLNNLITGTENQLELKKEYTTEYRNRKVKESLEKYNSNFSRLKIDEKLDTLHAEITLQNKQIDLITKALSTMILNQEDLLEKFNKNKSHQK